MAAVIIDGKAIADGITRKLKGEIVALKEKGKVPHLRAVQVGENPASRVYIRNQRQTCENLGISYTLDELPADSTQDALHEHIAKLNADADTTGIILQMPVPPPLDARLAQRTIAPAKDVEGMNPANLGKLLYGEARPGPCTAVGVMELLRSIEVKLEGKEVTVVGHSEIVGKPLALLLLAANASLRVAHIFTKDLAYHTKTAEVLIVAAGKSQALWSRYRSQKKKHDADPDKVAKPELPDLSYLISADMIKPGAVVIDVAINRIPVALDADGNPELNEKGRPRMRTVGDVDFEAAKEVASYITPVPGGVGPMTVAMLLFNTVETAKAQA